MFLISLCTSTSQCVSTENENIGKLSQSKSIVVDINNEPATTNNSEKPYVECSGKILIFFVVCNI